MLDPEAVRTLLAVLDEGTLDAAARKLHITPSAVSQRIKALEQRTGRVLLVRAKPARLTESGVAVARYGRQLDLVERETLGELGLALGPAPLSVAVNADSLNTWFRAVVKEVADDVLLSVRRDDQDYTADLLRQGLVVAAVTSTPSPVQGCRVDPLGAMRYHAVANKTFAKRWKGVPLDELPVIVFDEKDDLQDAFCRDRTGRPAAARRHHLPDSPVFEDAVVAGLGWGLLSEQQLRRHRGLVDLFPEHPVDVALHWQRWKLDSSVLRRVSEAVSEAAAAELRQPATGPYQPNL
ncbi:LysR family transcriptional regulator ArgP [Saccharothrix violaceirubra]|nr:LysR family transcriptional regulator ArgP [Saccharothrix violaceirubra]